LSANARDLAQFILDGEIIVSRLRADNNAPPELLARAERVLAEAKDELPWRVIRLKDSRWG